MELSFGEMILVVLVALLLFGPDKLPQIARDLGHGIRKMRGAMDEIKTEILKETDTPVSEIKKEIEKVKAQARQFDPTESIRKEFDMEASQPVVQSSETAPKIDPLDEAHEGPVSR